ncbi:hypothetical protein GQ42DRAFT_164466 [Ramicandelaber brevisporus]|nr:hypothetical protein GQ42DRAFT_164466 [Ramicandelaber brevisporus]
MFPTAHFAGVEEGGVPTVQDLTPHDTTWQASGTGSESQTLYIITDDDAVVLAQIAWANIGLYPTIQATFRYNSADGKTTVHRTVTCSTFTPSADKRSVKTEFMSIDAAKDGKSWTFMFGLTPAEAAHVRGTITFTATDRGYKIGSEGKVSLGYDDAKFIAHKFVPYGKCDGVITINGRNNIMLSGKGTFIHAYGQGVKPHSVAQRWSLVVANMPVAKVFTRPAGGDDSAWTAVQLETKDAGAHVSLLRYLTDKAFGAENMGMGSVFWQGKLHAVTTSNTAKPLNETLDHDTGYLVPGSVRYDLNGTTLPGYNAATVSGADTSGAASTGAKVHAEITVNNANQMARVDVLAELPYLIRRVIQALISKPYVYQFVGNGNATVILTDEADGSQTKLELDGRVFHEMTFMW